MLRAFRVFRLFKRIASLNKIVVSLGKVQNTEILIQADPSLLCARAAFDTMLTSKLSGGTIVDSR